MTTTDEIVDSIERSVDIDAPAERVWPLVSRPGWWINDQQIDPDPVVRHEGDLDVLVHPTHGEFRLRTEASDEPRYVRFHWVDNVAPDAGTSVELWIEDREGGGVTLRVKESGFTSLRKAQEEIANHVADNTRGWELELGLARDFVTGGGA